MSKRELERDTRRISRIGDIRRVSMIDVGSGAIGPVGPTSYLTFIREEPPFVR